MRKKAKFFKKPKYYVAIESTWDILTSHPSLEEAKRSLGYLIKHSDMTHDYFTILTTDYEGWFVPVREVVANG